MKFVKEIRERFRSAPVFTLRDVAAFLKAQGAAAGYAKLALHNLAAKGEIKRVTKGVYTFSTELMVAGFAFRPFYYGLQEALSIHGLWEQETVPIVITPKRVRQGRKEFLGNNFIVRRIARKMFFGFGMMKYYDFWIPVSDVEKTLVDFVYFREPLSKETMLEIKKRIRKEVLEDYLSRCPKRFAGRVRKLLN